MSTSPTLSISEPGDVFERLAACHGFLTARDVAKMLAISEKTVYSYVSRNMIPHYKIEANAFVPLNWSSGCETAHVSQHRHPSRQEDPPCIDACGAKRRGNDAARGEPARREFVSTAHT
jgi:hypothetical protein